MPVHHDMVNHMVDYVVVHHMVDYVVVHHMVHHMVRWRHRRGRLWRSHCWRRGC